MAGRKRYIQCPETHKLIPAEEYVRPTRQTHMVMEDIKPFKSPIDGSVISSRPQLEAHNRRHGVTNSADYPKEWVANRGKQRLREQQRNLKESRRADLMKAFDQMNRG